MKQRINSMFALRTIRLSASSILAAMFLSVLPVAMHAQQADNTRVISYQGAITTNSGSPVTGDHLITTTLYTDANGTLAVWSGTYKQRITGSVFSVLLGSGAYPLPAAQDFSKPLWIGVKIDGGEELKPLTQLTGAPFSFSISDNSVTKDKMAVDYVGSIKVNGKQITGKGTTLNLTAGPGTSLLFDETTNSLFFSSGGNGNLHGEKGAKTLGVGNSAACSPNFDTWSTILNRITPYVIGTNTFIDQFFGSCTPQDVIMQTHSTTQMTMLGATGLGNGLMFPASVNTGVGVIFQLQGAAVSTYIHSFGGPTNFFAGNQAGNLTMNAAAVDNTGVGYQTLLNNSGGVDATDLHYPAIQLGRRNTAVGSGALASNTMGPDNTGFGYHALNQNIGSVDHTHDNDPGFPPPAVLGTQNTAFGSGALEFNTTGWMNAATGYWALWQNTTGYKNTATGSCALELNTTGYGNTAFGWGSMTNNTTGTYNTGIGEDALNGNTTGYLNTACGVVALASNSTGYTNTACGAYGLNNNTTGYDNTSIGYKSLFINTIGIDNTASGYQALYNNSIGDYNTASGFDALYNNTIGDYNTASGYEALYSNWYGSDNTASGNEALYNNTDGEANTASGSFALYSNTTGSENTADYGGLFNNTTGNDNTTSGIEALYSNTTGSNNTASSSFSGATNTTGSNNTFVGYRANASGAALTNASAFGNYAIVGASSTIELGNASVTAVSTYGHIVTQSTIASPASAVDGVVVTILANATATGSDVAGNVIITTSATGAGTATFNFGTTYGTTAPIVMLTPANSAAADVTKTSTVFVTATATGFTVHLTDVANAAPSFNYHVIH